MSCRPGRQRTASIRPQCNAPPCRRLPPPRRPPLPSVWTGIPSSSPAAARSGWQASTPRKWANATKSRSIMPARRANCSMNFPAGRTSRSTSLPNKQQDKYGRLIADICLPDGRSLNALMVEAGAAFFYPHADLDPAYQDWLKSLQAAAIHERRGMWAWILTQPFALKSYTATRKAAASSLPLRRMRSASSRATACISARSWMLFWPGTPRRARPIPGRRPRKNDAGSFRAAAAWRRDRAGGLFRRAGFGHLPCLEPCALWPCADPGL